MTVWLLIGLVVALLASLVIHTWTLRQLRQHRTRNADAWSTGYVAGIQRGLKMAGQLHDRVDNPAVIQLDDRRANR